MFIVLCFFFILYVDHRDLHVLTTSCPTRRSSDLLYRRAGSFITTWGTYGNGEGQFDGAFGVAVDASGNVYVADTYNNRIQKFDSSGAFIIEWGTYETGRAHV